MRRPGSSGVTATAAAVSGATLSSALVNLAVAVLTARALSVAGRGELVMVVTITGISACCVGLGTGTAAKYHLGRADPRMTADHVVGLSLLLTAPQAALTAAVVWLTFGLVDAPERGGATIALVALFAASTLLYLQLLDTMNAVGQVVRAATVNLLGSVLQLAVLGSVAAAGGELRIASVFTVFTATALLQSLVVALMLRRSGHLRRPRLGSVPSRLLLRTGTPALGMNVAVSMTFRLDRYLIGLMAGASAVGVYSVAATASEALRLVPSSWGQVLCHRVASGAVGVRAVTAQLVRVLAAMAALAAVLWLAAGWLVSVFFGPAYAAAVTPLRVLLIAELLLVAFHIDVRVLAGLGRTKACGAAGLAGLAVVAVADVILIPLAGLVGAAWASVAGYAAMSLWARVAVAREPRPVAASPAPTPPVAAPAVPRQAKTVPTQAVESEP